MGDAGDASLRGAGDRDGADAVDAPEPELQLPDAGGGDPAGWALCAGAWRAQSRRGCSSTSTGRRGCGGGRRSSTAGGWQHDTLTEDTDLSYRAQLVGWKFKYLQDVECPAELPIEMTAFKTQQARWAKGLIQTGKKILPRVLKSDAPWHTKLEAWYHLTANISYPLMIVLSVLLMPAMIIRSWQGYIQMLLIDLPLFVASTMSVSTFYLVSQKELYPKSWYKSILYVPFVMALGGVGLTITNTKAVMEALFGIKSAFARTPKYSVQKKGEKSQAKVYRKRLGIVPWIELGIGCYFAWTVYYAVSTENFFTVPFLLLFVFGYWYTGLLSLLQGRFERGGERAGSAREAVSGRDLDVLNCVAMDAVGAGRLECLMKPAAAEPLVNYVNRYH